MFEAALHYTQLSMMRFSLFNLRNDKEMFGVSKDTIIGAMDDDLFDVKTATLDWVRQMDQKCSETYYQAVYDQMIDNLQKYRAHFVKMVGEWYIGDQELLLSLEERYLSHVNPVMRPFIQKQLLYSHGSWNKDTSMNMVIEKIHSDNKRKTDSDESTTKNKRVKYL